MQYIHVVHLWHDSRTTLHGAQRIQKRNRLSRADRRTMRCYTISCAAQCCSSVRTSTVRHDKCCTIPKCKKNIAGLSAQQCCATLTVRERLKERRLARRIRQRRRPIARIAGSSPSKVYTGRPITHHMHVFPPPSIRTVDVIDALFDVPLGAPSCELLYVRARVKSFLFIFFFT